jgi:hypothetical protein
MTLPVIALILTLGLFAGMVALLHLGRYIGTRRLARDPESAQSGSGAIDGAVFALLGLMVAFTFSGASTRFDDRRALIVQEANTIGTAYLRLDLLPADVQPELRELFRRYTTARVEAYRKLPDRVAAQAEVVRAVALQGDIWSRAVAAAQRPGVSPAVASLVMPALNDMFDIVTTRTNTTLMHPPRVIFLLLFGLSLAAALLAGYAMAGSRTFSSLHSITFAAVMAITVNLILNIEFPRLGMVGLEEFDQAIVVVLESMK